VKTGDRETGDGGTLKDSGAPSEGAGNVIRLPREWIGPLEELVPIRPATPTDESGITSADDALPPTADAFWSEDAGALHNAVRAPDGAVAAERAVDGSAGGQVRRRPHFGSVRAGLGWPARRVRMRPLGAVVVAVPLVALAAIGTLWSLGGGSGPAANEHRGTAQQASIGQGFATNPALGHRGLPEDSASTQSATSRAASGHRSARRATRSHRRQTRRRIESGSAAANRIAPPSPSAPSSAGSESVVQTSVGSGTSGGSLPAAANPGAATSPTSPVRQSPSPEATSASNSGASSTPAFGAGGALGPGSSPNS
jgi:hypothetical protein